jgi:hypothetical protein
MCGIGGNQKHFFVGAFISNVKGAGRSARGLSGASLASE